MPRCEGGTIKDQESLKAVKAFLSSGESFRMTRVLEKSVPIKSTPMQASWSIVLRSEFYGQWENELIERVKLIKGS